jgi:hypothetical protein
MPVIEPIEPYIKLTGEERRRVAAQLADRYHAGRSIRQLMKETGRSYGAIYRLLAEAGVTMRSRGGANRQRTPAPVRRWL